MPSMLIPGLQTFPSSVQGSMGILQASSVLLVSGVARMQAGICDS